MRPKELVERWKDEIDMKRIPSLPFASLPLMPKKALILIGVVTALAAWCFLSGVGPGFPLDDAWCHQVYARGIAQGEVFTYNTGEREAGVSSPLWTVLCAVPIFIAERVLDQSRPDEGIRLLSGLIGFLAIVAGVKLARRAGIWSGASALALLTFDPLSLFGCFSGMEQPLFTLLFFILIGALLDERPRRAGWASGLLMLTRPEGVVLGLFALVILRKQRTLLLGTVSRIVLCVAPFLAYNLMVAGHPLPNTYLMKWSPVFDLSQYWATTQALLGDTGYGWALLVMLGAGIISLEGGSHRLGRLPLQASLLLFAAILCTRPMQVATTEISTYVPYYWQRYALLAWPPILLVAAAGLASIVRTAWAGLFCRPLSTCVLLIPLALVIFFGRDAPTHWVALQQRFAAGCATVESQNVAAGRWLDENLPSGAQVATHDAGAIRYFSRRRVIDIYGNNNATLVRALTTSDPDSNDPGKAARTVLSKERPDALVILAHPQLGWIDYAPFFGLTKPAAAFHVDEPGAIPDPTHQDLAIFVRP
ncbi:MAG: hypothetical protein VX916_03810 [Planctomycetota bacterium]|nr:hypothetical protein [Planctomycetota bacterium]